MAEERVQRRLATILAADVVGYSRLMGLDEEGTLAAHTAHRSELIEPSNGEHRGRVVKMTGDGLLAEFASVSMGSCARPISGPQRPFATATFRRNGASILACRNRVCDKAMWRNRTSII